MGKPKKAKKVKLIIGILAKDKKLFDSIEEFFLKDFGEIDYRSPDIPFSCTDYYKDEMGAPLKKRFLSFKKLIAPERLPDIKIKTNNIEEKFSKKQKRQINIDPGYVSDSKLVLATTKNYFHRIYLNKGIYAEVTLRWKKGSFHPFDWTYPDYKSGEYIDLLNHVRSSYMKDK